MTKDYRVDITPSGSGFFVTITEIFAGGTLSAVVAGAIFLVILYVVFGCPVVIWPMLYDELQSVFESNVYFWLLVGAQVAFAFTRLAAMSAAGEPSALFEITIESAFFFAAFELVQALGFYVGLKAIDPEILREAGVYGMSFVDVLGHQLSTDLSSPLSTLFLAYCGGFAPAAITCILHELLES